MESVQSDALVLRGSPYGEAHRIVTLATRQGGTIRVFARNARKSLKRFPGGLDYFTLLRIDAAKPRRQELWELRRTSVLRYYEGVVGDAARYGAGCWAVDLFRSLVREELHDPACFEWLAGCLDHLEGHAPDAAFAFTAFLGLVRLLGFCPRLDECAACGRPAPEGRSAWFAFDAGGVVCTRCGGGGTLLSARTRRFVAAAARVDSLRELEDMPDEMAAAARDGRELLLDLVDRIAAGLSGKDRSFTTLLRKTL